jgi:hypothetical protein
VGANAKELAAFAHELGYSQELDRASRSAKGYGHVTSRLCIRGTDAAA